MTYPKKLMSITELRKLGFPKETLYKIAHINNAPVIRTAGGGKIFFVTENLDDFIKFAKER